MFEQTIPYRARLTPNDPALWTESGEFSYQRFNADIDRTAHRLMQMGLKPNSTVLIDVEPLTIHWLVIMALERLGHTSVSASLRSGSDGAIGIVSPDGVISNKPADTFSRGLNALCIDGVWLNETLQLPLQPAVRSEARPDDLIRIVLSSGTTGRPKRIPLTRVEIDGRLSIPPVLGEGIMRGLTTMGVATAFGFRSPLLCWWLGGVAILPRTFNQDTIDRSAPTAITMATQQLAVHLSENPQAFRGSRKIKIYVGGSVVPPSLVQGLAERGGATLVVGYGSTETSSMAYGDGALILRQPGSVGHVAPWASVEIVSSEGAVLPVDEVGEVRIRTQGMAAGYMDEVEGASGFRDGWFYPGDFGRLNAGGELIIEGRADDLINIGGVKLYPFDVEERAAQWPGVSDAAVVALPMASGRWVLFCAVAASDDCDTNGLELAIAQKFNVTARVVVLPQIKRNGMGKIERHAVRAEITESFNAKVG